MAVALPSAFSFPGNRGYASLNAMATSKRCPRCGKQPADPRLVQCPECFEMYREVTEAAHPSTQDQTTAAARLVLASPVLWCSIILFLLAGGGGIFFFVHHETEAMHRE